jgi:hypothetical protein
LATLPFELEVVNEGDVGDISLLDDEELLITQEFNNMVNEIIKKPQNDISPVNHDHKRVLQAG